jgi:hypothetical protein
MVAYGEEGVREGFAEIGRSIAKSEQYAVLDAAGTSGHPKGLEDHRSNS